MEAFLKNAQTVDWWVGIVVVGLLINVVSVFLSRALEGGLSRVSKRWAERTAKSAAKDRAEIAKLIKYPEARQIAFQYEMRSRIRATLMILVAFDMLFLSNLAAGSLILRTAVGILSSLAALMGTIDLMRVVRYFRQAGEVRDALNNEFERDHPA